MVRIRTTYTLPLSYCACKLYNCNQLCLLTSSTRTMEAGRNKHVAHLAAYNVCFQLTGADSSLYQPRNSQPLKLLSISLSRQARNHLAIFGASTVINFPTFPSPAAVRRQAHAGRTCGPCRSLTTQALRPGHACITRSIRFESFERSGSEQPSANESLARQTGRTAYARPGMMLRGDLRGT